MFVTMQLSNGNNIIEDLFLLFEKMDTLSLLLLVSGFVLCTAHLIRPTYKALFIIGSILIITGFVTRLSNEGTLAMLFILGVCVSAPLMMFFYLGIAVNKYNWLTPTSEPVVPDDNFLDKEFYFLLNHEGVSATVLSPIGKIIINEIQFEARSFNGETIQRNTPIRVIEVENEQIIVKAV